MKYIHILVLLVTLTICQSAKILYIMPFTAKSHYLGMKTLALELAAKGHEVYAISPYKDDVYPKTYYPLIVENKSFWEELFDEKPNVFSTVDVSFTDFQIVYYKSAFMVNDIVFGSKDVQKMLRENHKFDLVISEVFTNEALYMFAHKYQAPLILVTTFGNSLKTNYLSRNPLQLSTVYHEYAASYDTLSFIGRLKNIYVSAFDLMMLKYWYLPKLEEGTFEYWKNYTLPQPVPSLEELAANVSVVLMNSHFSIDTPAAYLPNFIEVGGLHIKSTTNALPEDLQKILDGAKNGVVFLSFGSNVQSTDLSKDKLDAFLKVFGELKQTVLMKWEDTTLPNVPKNVVLRNWFPQRDVLAHPNVKLFIGHGGLLGLQETIAAGVPILGVPVYGDQYNNLFDTSQRGHGEILEYKQITETTLRKLINKMLTEKSYSLKAKEISARFKDRPMSSLETAIWWVEYVIRHKGANYIKTPALGMNCFAYHNIDIMVFLIAVLLIIIYVLFKLVAIIKSIVCKSSKTQIKKKKNK